MANLDRHNLVNGLVGFLFATTGPLAILLSVSVKGGLSEEYIASWIFAGYGFGGVLSILASLIYRQPIGMAWTIPGAVLLGPALDHLTFPEVVGAYLVTGVLISVAGLSGWIRKAMAAIPMPIVMGMVAGVFLPFGLNIISAFQSALWIALSMIAAFTIVSVVPAVARTFPPILGALIVGAGVTLFTGHAGVDRSLIFSLASPHLFMPVFSIQAILELVIPLAITVVGIHNAQGFAILKNESYDPPINTLTVACGVGTLFFGIFGAVPTCVTGPVNGILNSSGARERRYIGGIFFGLLIFMFGLLAPVAAQLGLMMPSAFIGMLGGLAIIRVLQGAFSVAFSARFPLGALATFIVTVSDATILHIGSPFWGIVFGIAVSWLMERDDFRKLWQGF